MPPTPATLPAPAPATSNGRRRAGTPRTQTLYAALQKEVVELGLMRRRYVYYAIRTSTAVAAVVAAFVALVILGPTWWQLAVAAFLGFALTQVAFLGHDAAHRQIFATPARNEWTSRLLGGVVIGMSYGWWHTKHNRHHSAPNQVGKDPDIEPGVLSWTPEISAERRGFSGWLTRRQGWLFFPLLLLAGVGFHVSNFRALLGSRPIRWRRLELAITTTRLVGYLVLVFVILPPGMAAAFVGVHLGVFGLYMGMSFAPNHKGMPLVPRGATVDFLRRQVLMSRNIRGGRLTTFLMGGLDLQIEHHLFPSMPRPNLRKVRPLVKEFCRRHEITYTETSLLRSYAIVVRYLNQVGLGERDPFKCPLVQQYRTL